MKTIKTANFRRSLAALRRQKENYFRKHPTEMWRYVRLQTPDNKQWAIVRLRNPGLSNSRTNSLTPSRPLRAAPPLPEREGEILLRVEARSNEEGEDAEPNQ